MNHEKHESHEKMQKTLFSSLPDLLYLSLRRLR